MFFGKSPLIPSLVLVLWMPAIFAACQDASGTLDIRPPTCFLNPTTSDGTPLGYSSVDLSKLADRLASRGAQSILSSDLLMEMGEVPGDTTPYRDIRFVVRVLKADGQPLGNSTVIYSYVSKPIDGSAETIAFTQELVTDANGFITLGQSAQQQITLHGSSQSSSTSDSSSLIAALLFGSSGDERGSSSFTISAQKSSVPIVLSGAYAGRVTVSGVVAGHPEQLKSNALLSDAEAQKSSLGQQARYVRMGSISSFSQGNDCSGGGPDGCRDSYLSGEILSTGILYRNTIDSSFSCATLMHHKGDEFEESSNVTFTGADGQPATCDEIEKHVPDATCTQDWDLTVWEIHKLQ